MNINKPTHTFSPQIQPKSIENQKNPKSKKSISKVLFDKIPREQRSRIRSHFLNNLITKNLNEPKKMKIKEFETHILESLESINLVVRNGLISLKRFMNDISVSEGTLLRQFYESILLGSLAGNSLDIRKRTVEHFQQKRDGEAGVDADRDLETESVHLRQLHRPYE